MSRPPMNGALALVGSGEYLELSDELERSLLNLGAERIGSTLPPVFVQLPTASGHESESRRLHWRDLGARAAARLGAEARYLDIQNREDALAFEGTLVDASLIYLSGGDPYRLTDVLVGTPLWSAIRKAFAGGASLAGCSAGAMAICSHVVNLRSLGRSSRDGLRLVNDLQVIPHFDRFHLASRAPRWWPVPTLGIDESTALVWNGSDGPGWRVWGAGSVNLFGPEVPHGRISVGAGEGLSLAGPLAIA